jgi:hypothetical protein
MIIASLDALYDTESAARIISLFGIQGGFTMKVAAVGLRPAFERGVVLSRGAILGWDLFHQLLAREFAVGGIYEADDAANALLDDFANASETEIEPGSEGPSEWNIIAIEFFLNQGMLKQSLILGRIVDETLDKWVAAVAPLFEPLAALTAQIAASRPISSRGSVGADWI